VGDVGVSSPEDLMISPDDHVGRERNDPRSRTKSKRGEVAGRWFNRPLALVLAVAALLRFGVLLIRSFREKRFLTPDTAGYQTLAKDLGAFTSKSNPHFGLSMLRTPVYPLYLSFTHLITDSRIIGPMTIQVLIGVAVVYVTYRLALSLFGRSVALWAAAILAIDPVSVIYSSLILTETLYAFFLVGAVLLLWRPQDNRWTRALAAGVLLGLATLTRPVSIYLSVVVAVGYLILERQDLRKAGLVVVAFLIGFGVVAGGWIIRNDVMGGVATISTIEGYNILYYRAVGALAESDHLTQTKAHHRLSKELKHELPRHATPGQVDKAEESLGTKIIREHVTGYVKEAAKGGGRLVFGPGNAELATATAKHVTDVVDGYAIVYLIGCYLLGLIGLWSAWRTYRLRICLLPLLVIIYTVVVSSGLEAYSRFRVPIMPFFALLAGLGLVAIVNGGPDTAALPPTTATH
jgi:4-amino-4-deoxy-L-arabinose transferase-like glycosyltransferase